MNYYRIIVSSMQQKLSLYSLVISMLLLLASLPTNNIVAAAHEIVQDVNPREKVQIKGYVFDNNRIPLFGAIVAEEGTTNAVTVSEDGSYIIEIIPKDGLRLLYSFFGMRSQTIEVHKRTVIDVTMVPLEGKLDEVIVTGYGNILKEAYTGSASIITADDIRDRAVSSFEGLLQGLSPGIVVGSSGQPGDIAEVRLRGFGSMNSSNQPLYVIDGVVFDQDNTSGHSNAVSSPMATLNPADIASITILKDAASASLYGSQGANGVIVITTKQGVASDRIRYTFSAQAGASKIFSSMKPKLVNSLEYRELWTEGQFHRLVSQQSGNFNENLANLYNNKVGYKVNGKNYLEWYKQAQQDFNKYYAIPRPDGTYHNYDYWGADEDKLPNVDWFDEITRIAAFQQYDFSMSGGSNSFKYYLSLGHLDQQGVILNSELKRHSARFNVNYDDKSKLINWGANASLSRTKQSGPIGTGLNYNQPHYAALLLPSVVPAYLEDGSYNFQFPNNLLNGNHNPIASAKENVRKRPQLNLFVSGWLRLNLAKWVDFRADISQFYITGRRAEYFSKDFGSGFGGNGDMVDYDSKRTKLTSKNMFNFSHTINNRHRIGGTAGVELVNFRQEWNSVSVVNFLSDDKPVISSGAEVSGWSGSGYDYSLVSLISRADYSYRYRYFAGASFRQDRSSRFAPEHRTGNFWSVSGAYRLTNEGWGWVKKLGKIVNHIQFKASYGHNGTLPSGYYYWRTLYGTGRYNAEHALAQSFRATYDLTWEKNKVYNIGVDLGFFKNKIRMTAEYYQRKSSDLLQSVPVSQSSGYRTMLMNTSAGIKNSGFELDINANVIDNLFKWDVKFNLATLSSKYYGLEQDIIGTHIMRNGESVSSWYMNEFAGINSFTGGILYYAYDKETGQKVLASNDNPSERRILGKGIPSVTGGFTTVFDYQGWQLSALFTYGWGHKIYDSRSASRIGTDGQSMDYNASKDQLDRWTPDNPFGKNRLRNNGQLSAGGSSRYLYKGDYLKLKNIKLQYVFPASTFRKVGINGATMFAQVENLWVLTELDGYDPDLQINGFVNDARYPSATTFTFGLNINF